MLFNKPFRDLGHFYTAWGSVFHFICVIHILIKPGSRKQTVISNKADIIYELLNQIKYTLVSCFLYTLWIIISTVRQV